MKPTKKNQMQTDTYLAEVRYADANGRVLAILKSNEIAVIGRCPDPTVKAGDTIKISRRDGLRRMTDWEFVSK